MHLPSLLLTLLTSTTTAITITTTQTTSSPTPSAAPASTQYTNNQTFETAILSAHNFYRSEHNASDLIWNSTSATFAQDWSDQCNFQHSGAPTGENLAAGYANASSSIDAWGLERLHYNWAQPHFSETTGHFTQVVWSNTTSVGCGRSSCQGAHGTPGWYVVCEYFPAGNVIEGDDGGGFFRANVKRLIKGRLTDSVESGVVTSMGLVGRELWGGMGMWRAVGMVVLVVFVFS